ncbi:MAG: hypothetical protein AVDCRST_MAG74-98 [uncultured Pyrinomonadaceae bacterium]|uniref:HTH gntR-type domain-containing protein n=1 Tax=uncultured Pyrinomonadaceae bacterium TaxID=2283094 RepID=A0A6J4N996_9BACT|nr:MAG: hypothetical protein AVDCRST_MAG74-98 [uncultured Pyrinomonadaceae bacterium]
MQNLKSTNVTGSLKRRLETSERRKNESITKNEVSEPTILKTIDSTLPRKTSDEVALKLREMIERGELNAGDRLPPERDLAKQLGVSRPTLRNGLRSLAAVGMLQSRQGAGTFLVESKESPTLDGNALQMMAALHGFTSAEMFETRLSLETCIAGLAAERATSEQIATLAEEIAEMYASLDDPEQFLTHDMRFHQMLAAASGNRILTALMNMVAKILLEARFNTTPSAAELKETAESQRRIYRRIRERQPETAREAMREHLLKAKKAQAEEVADNFAAETGKKISGKGVSKK